jgi:hypothetical protein
MPKDPLENMQLPEELTPKQKFLWGLRSIEMHIHDLKSNLASLNAEDNDEIYQALGEAENKIWFVRYLKI